MFNPALSRCPLFPLILQHFQFYTSDTSALKTEAISSSDTSVFLYVTAWSHISEYCSLQIVSTAC
jgi:hypothetical protein